ncbi:Protein CBG22886 [Caenorhabditis briggsae]|uniref:Protein CBG22886 n=1 Tax=Caenorhabditis briggsae TaxID=6238 RepID=A8Y3A8_CAEBR|nr:Protein CBG22886 [Caenorhabditis briggsae]CAP39377.2 Protein CBG22886 [Caenorhabditis briggsae]
MNSEALICEICGQEARGSHYGAVACRACAAFFRRTGTSKHIKPCSRKKQCKFFKNGFFTCKFCRLQKCFTVGMSSETFQFDRDAYKVREMVQLDRRIPMGSETPLIARNSLGKMAFGFRKIQNEDQIFENLHKIPEFGKTQTLAQWEYYILKMTKWLTYFDDFQKLEQSLQIKMIQGIWSIWKKLERLAAIAMCIRRKLSEETIRKMKNGTLLCNWNQMKIDMSWCSKYSLEELKL